MRLGKCRRNGNYFRTTNGQPCLCADCRAICPLKAPKCYGACIGPVLACDGVRRKVLVESAVPV